MVLQSQSFFLHILLFADFSIIIFTLTNDLNLFFDAAKQTLEEDLSSVVETINLTK